MIYSVLMKREKSVEDSYIQCFFGKTDEDIGNETYY